MIPKDLNDCLESVMLVFWLCVFTIHCKYSICHFLIDVHLYKFFTCLDINKIRLNHTNKQCYRTGFFSSFCVHVSVVLESIYLTHAEVWFTLPNSSSGYNDELAFGAVWLYRATKENRYLQRAREFYNSGAAWAFSWDSKNPGVQVKTPLQYYLIIWERL